MRRLITMSWNAEYWNARNLAIELANLNYPNVYWYRGGLEAWDAAGLPTVSNRAGAIADYDEEIQLHPNSAAAYYQRGEAYRAMGHADRAIADLSEAIKNSTPNSPAPTTIAASPMLPKTTSIMPSLTSPRRYSSIRRSQTPISGGPVLAGWRTTTMAPLRMLVKQSGFLVISRMDISTAGTPIWRRAISIMPSRTTTRQSAGFLTRMRLFSAAAAPISTAAISQKPKQIFSAPLISVRISLGERYGSISRNGAASSRGGSSKPRAGST